MGSRLGSVSSVFLRFALGLSFLSVVADRFGWWGASGQPNVAWGDFARFEANGEQQLTRISELLDAGDLHPVVDAVLPLGQAAAAYAGEIRSGLGHGRMVVAVAAES
jgi:NADPH:quinone reductase-like Zn-dependent oxidoreductase